MNLRDYVTLGRTGLRVSPLCLGTMTFGTDWGWGSAEDTARQILDRFLSAGGNFVDTADGYTNGASESMLGRFLKERDRDGVVLATKYTFSTKPGDPNGGGNGRKHLHSALEASLKRLQSDYIDLYWVHAWDKVTPVEEVIRTLDDLVRAGKIRHYGFSNVPAWYLGRAHALAELRGWERVSALQLEYSLVERNIEREYVPAALELGLGICPWSPLGSGLLSGKYRREGTLPSGSGRLEVMKSSGHPAFSKLFTERNWKIVDAVGAVAKELGRPPAQVALSWVTRRPGVSSTIIGATKLNQLDDNLAALELEIPPELTHQLDEASRPEILSPANFFEPEMQAMISGGTRVTRG